MERRITFFIASAERSGKSWIVRGEVGLGPLREGDEFSFVHHQDAGDEEPLTLRIERMADTELVVTPSRDVALRQGDILGGETAR